MGKASSVNEKTVLITKQLHRVFFDHLVWTKEEELEKRAGLFVKTLELPAPQQVAFKWASHWWFVNFANKFGLYKMIARDGAKLIASSPFLISTVMNNNTKESFVLSGRLMQRVCLKLTQMGHSTHPVTGVLFLYQRVLGKDTKGLSSKQVKDIDEAYKKIAEICGVDNDGLVTLLLRTGDGGSPSDISSRLEPKIDFFDN